METNSKRAKVIMLPTEDKSIIYADQNNAPQLYERYQGIKQGQLMSNQPPKFNNQHLYFTTDEEIKEGDWCYNVSGTFDDKKIFKVTEGILFHAKVFCRKIVATTDNLVTGTVKTFHDKRGFTEQYLPQPSQAFIEKYCELGGIDEVLVEYEVTFNGKKYLPENRVVQVKTDSHNTVTIHPVKNSWSKEEVMQLIRTFDMTMGRDITTKAFDDWINKNLKA